MTSDAVELLVNLIGLGIELGLDGRNGIRYRPRNALDANLRQQLVSQKPSLLPILRRMIEPPFPEGLWARCASAMLSKVDHSEDRVWLREAFEERAAICEYDGNLARDEAERVAFLQLQRLMRQVAPNRSNRGSQARQPG